MSSSNEDLKCLYENAISLGTHFSSLVNKERILVITIGFIVIGACGKVIISGDHLWLPVFISLGGVFLAGSIWALAHHHRSHAHDCFKSAIMFENELCKKIGQESGAIRSIEQQHDKIENSPVLFYIQVHGTFISMEAVCFVVFIYSLIQNF